MSTRGINLCCTYKSDYRRVPAVKPMVSTMVFWILAISAGLLGCQGSVIEDNLISLLLNDYNKMARPATVNSPVVDVDHGMSILRIESVKGDKVTINTWLVLKWNDTRFEWNPEDHYNLTHINMHASALWMPDIVQYNSASFDSGANWQNLLAVVSNHGEVTVVPSIRLSTHCAVSEDGEVFNCALKFGSWTYSGWKIDVDNKDKTINMGDLQDSEDWDVTDWTVKHNVVQYSCCPEPYVTLTYTLVLKRKHHRHHCH